MAKVDTENYRGIATDHGCLYNSHIYTAKSKRWLYRFLKCRHPLLSVYVFSDVFPKRLKAKIAILRILSTLYEHYMALGRA